MTGMMKNNLGMMVPQARAAENHLNCICSLGGLALQLCHGCKQPPLIAPVISRETFNATRRPSLESRRLASRTLRTRLTARNHAKL